MKGLVSIYLDAFRFLAAMGVFLSHVQQHSAAPGVLPVVSLDHKLVVFFFVISGYVIAGSVSRPDATVAKYSADRLARLSSVVIPALAVTYFLDTIGSALSPQVYAGIDPHWQPLRFLANFFYLQQIWFLCVNPSSNAPLWSLGYEFWYYVLFGIWLFVKSSRAKILLLALVSLVIGPKILLLLPAWAVGALAFHAGKNLQCSFRAGLGLFIASGLGVAAAVAFTSELGLTNGKSGLPPLYYSSDYIRDNLFAAIVALHFFCCALFSKRLAVNFEPLPIVRFIRWLADHTFSLYVYHMPILYFLRAVLGYDTHNLFAVLSAMCLALLIIAGLSKITEERYAALRIAARSWMAGFAGRMRPVAIKWKLSPAPVASGKAS